ncbi:hypothetical protein A2U01_0053313 [Trifolium medium]|uniref:Uncharacterized protein n=1 Tax=Trifolium medium TaxID=97028 RepID=A0A392R677_9FABA|nr:hypothetical protein [Trifolium medium]
MGLWLVPTSLTSTALTASMKIAKYMYRVSTSIGLESTGVGRVPSLVGSTLPRTPRSIRKSTFSSVVCRMGVHAERIEI